MGTPQGGPLSPLLANVLLDEVDKELERRGHCFVRYADDCNVYVGSRKAGERVMALLRRLYGRLHLTINEGKSAVTSVFGRKFLGFSFWRGRDGAVKRRVADKPLKAFKRRVRQLTRRSGGRSMAEVAERLRVYVLGWKAYGWHKLQGSSRSWRSGCVTGCARSSASTGSVARPPTRPCLPRAPSPKWHGRSRPTAADGGATAACCSIRS